LAEAIRHHMEGQYDEAERIYLRLHQHNRNDEEVLYLIGVLCCDLGIFQQACRFLEQAQKLNPQFPEAAQQLVVALKGQAGQDMEGGKFALAEAGLRRARKLAPNDDDCLLLLGRAAMLRSNFVLAESLLNDFLQRAPEHEEALNWHGLACLQQKKYEAADQSLRRALAVNPKQSQVRNNLGISLYEQGRVAEAHDCFLTALIHDPSYVNARVNLANTLRLLGHAQEARVHIEQLLLADPDSVELLNNLGTVLQDLGEALPARQILERAVAIAPASPQARWNLALSQLLLGDYGHGWENFEARWDGCANLRGAYDKPAKLAWRGESLAGKRILLWAEQGFGDSLQFIRFADRLQQSGATVIVEAQPELARLLASAPGVAQVVARGAALPPYDFHCPLMSLPYRLGIADLAAVGRTAYLTPDPAQSSHWKTQLARFPGRRIGLAWAGKSRLQNAELAAIDARRSVKLQQLAVIIETADCSFFSLQKGPQADEIRAAGLPLHDFSAAWGDFADTAAFIVNLDLVITVDTAIAHLAGALGKPVWLLNRRDTCWRWLLERADSHWYPTLRQFRQTRGGDWESVVAAVAAELKNFSPR
jgi:Flp pilus assembly protein TadD